MVKTVHIHVGPHKTGSTAIQEALRERSQTIAEILGIEVIHGNLISQIALSLKKEDEVLAHKQLAGLSRLCQNTPGDCVISCEDLAGDLPGRTGKRRPYPRLWHNINLLIKALSPHRCMFYFFVREREAWLKSAYVQNLKHRTRFSSLEEFKEFVLIDELWDGVLAKTAAKLGDQLVCIPYLEGESFSSIDALLSQVSQNNKVSALKIGKARVNSMPSNDVIRVLERINQSSASREAKRKAKKFVIGPTSRHQASAEEMSFPTWGQPPVKPDWLTQDLENLWSRVEQRVHHQEQPNLLPDPFSDLSHFRTQTVVAPDEFPEGGRGDMANQRQILAYRFHRFPETCLLLGLVISYLRRQTEHTEHAAFLFQRLWEEEYDILLGTLQTRWLISTFQTFLDHGANEQQRIIGGSAYFFSNLLKAYEAERAIEGLNADATYPNTQPVTKSGFAGLDRFNLGGTDLMLNMNALLLEISSKDERAGRVVQEFLSRLKRANTMFSRMDNNRIAHGIDNQQFSNCWSFFERPG